MGDVLFVTWWGGGNQNPLLALGETLQERGHRVRVLGAENLVDRFDRFDRSLTAGGMPTADEVLRERADVVVVDYMATDALCGAEASGVPVVGYVHTLYWRMMHDGELMPMVMAGGPAVINETRLRLGLRPVTHLVEMLDHCAGAFVTTIETLDEPAAAPLPPNVQYCGPLLERPGPDADWLPPFDTDDDRPLVVAAMGTTPMGEEPVIQRVLDAVAELDVRALVNTGAHVDPWQFTVPANAVVRGFVQHRAVLPHASAVVTHAGLGTVSAGLTFGLPLVCVPLDRDQPGNAARVEAIGAGRAIGKGDDVATFRSAINDVLADPKYGAAARRCAEEIETRTAQQIAVQMIEAQLP